ncbi:MAG: response regulator [Sphingobacteriales bacterium]|nr:MAG: response regulator [Sphingobacteriales bacterium]
MGERILIVEDEYIVAHDLMMMLERAGYKISGIASSVNKALECIETEKPDWVLLDIFLQGNKTGIDLAGMLTERAIPFIYISASTNQSVLESAKTTLPYGFLVKPFRENDLLIMLDIARYRHTQNIKYSVSLDALSAKTLSDIFSSNDAHSEKINKIGYTIDSAIPFDFLWITQKRPKVKLRDLNIEKSADGIYALVDNDRLLKKTAVSFRDFKASTSSELQFSGKPVINGYEFRKLRMENDWIRILSDTFGLQSAILSELTRNDETFTVLFFSKHADFYQKHHHDALIAFEKGIEILADKIIFEKELSKSLQSPVAAQKDKIENKKTGTQNSVEKLSSFNSIIGKSPLLLNALNKIKLVAPDDTSVLILGESGTGKENVARSVHELSPRKSGPMITVNCAALPLSLIESELFGHEKGSFTGANERRIGKFEQADGGSIFLDEIGELPLEAQVKLLRVLQEKEIERLGGNLAKKVNVRIITATNRNLEKEVAEGRFRLDLYYRLNVFPIELPPLRERREDIPILTSHFIRKFTKDSHSQIKHISKEALAQLESYEWPGNIRELEHIIERTILLTDGETIRELKLPPSIKPKKQIEATGFQVRTMEEVEREHILSILKMCKGKIFGPGGAAEILNMPSTTLNSKIKKLGIKHEFVL